MGQIFSCRPRKDTGQEGTPTGDATDSTRHDRGNTEKHERFIPTPTTKEENAESAGHSKAVQDVSKIAGEVLLRSSKPAEQADETHSTGSSEHESSSEEEALTPEELQRISSPSKQAGNITKKASWH
jgi:hypothetical protein